MDDLADLVNGAAVLPWEASAGGGVFVVVCEDDAVSDQQLLDRFANEFQAGGLLCLICKRPHRITYALAGGNVDDPAEAAAAAAVRAYRALAQGTGDRIEAISLRLSQLAVDLYLSILKRFLSGLVVEELDALEDGAVVCAEAPGRPLQVLFPSHFPPYCAAHLARQLLGGLPMELVGALPADARPVTRIEYTLASNIDSYPDAGFVYFKYGLLIKQT